MVALKQRFLLQRRQESDRPVLSREGGTGQGDTGRGGVRPGSRGPAGEPGKLACVVTPLSHGGGLASRARDQGPGRARLGWVRGDWSAAGHAFRDLGSGEVCGLQRLEPWG